MKIMPITNKQPQFGTKLKLQRIDVNTIVGDALSHDINAGIPKLYTLLQYLKKMPEETAEFSRLKGLDYNHYQLRINNKLVKEGRDTYEILYDLTTPKKTSDGKKIPMPTSIFEKSWWENTDKTYQDIEEMLNQ